MTVSARDYAFNGSGLVLYWDDIDKRLKSLQIAHGKDLTLYDAGDLSPKPAPRLRLRPPITGPAQPAGTEATASPSEPRQRYTATFYDQVRVIQGGDQLVEADRMDVDFAPKGDNSPAPAQSSAPATAPTNSASPSASPANDRADSATDPYPLAGPDADGADRFSQRGAAGGWEGDCRSGWIAGESPSGRSR